LTIAIGILFAGPLTGIVYKSFLLPKS